MEPEAPRAKGIGCSLSLPEDITDAAEAHDVLMDLAKSVSERLQSHQFLAGKVSASIRRASFRAFFHQAALEKKACRRMGNPAAGLPAVR